MSLGFKYAALSNIGKIRQSNQDSGYAGPNLLVLADGMGGPAGGDIASSIAIDHLRGLDCPADNPEQALDSLRDAINEAHQELCERSTQDPALAGLGTTCIAIRRSENDLTMTHIGDSRAYRLRGGELRQMTNDHSFVQYLVDTGQLTPDQAENHPQRSVLLRVLGDSQEDVTLDESHPEFTVGDRWLLCSDGLCGFVSGQTIGKVLYRSESPKQACESLVELALKAGGPDNVTCVVAEIVENPDQDEPEVVGAAATDRLQQVRCQHDESMPVAESRNPDTPTPDLDSPASSSESSISSFETSSEDETADSVLEQAQAAVPTESLTDKNSAPKFRWGRAIGVIVGIIVLITLFALALWYGLSQRSSTSLPESAVTVSQVSLPATSAPLVETSTTAGQAKTPAISI